MSEPTEGPPKGQLRLVRLLAPKPRYTKRRPVFTEAQQAWLRSSLRNAARAFGGRPCLAAALGMSLDRLSGAMKDRNRVSAEIVVRLAQATGAPLDALLRPGGEDAGRCPTCGRTREGVQ